MVVVLTISLQPKKPIMSRVPVLKFKAPLGYRITIISSWLFFLVTFCFVLVSEIMDEASQNRNTIKIAFGCIAILFVFGALVFTHVSKTIVVKDEVIYYSSLLKKKQIRLREVKGYENHKHYVIIIPLKTDIHEKIRMTASFALNEWLSENLTYLGLGLY